MKKKIGTLQTEAEIRILAEKKLRKRFPNLKNKTLNETDKLIHELQVHKIELELQNEELRASQSELDESREKYYDLYENAPAGYISINQHGIVTDVNQTASSLLCIEKYKLLKKPFTNFIIKEDQDIYYLNNNRQRKTKEKQQFDIRLKRKDKSSFWARIESIYMDKGDIGFTTRISISDINEQKKIEEALLESERSYKSLTENSIDYVMRYDRECRHTFMNKAGIKVSGLKEEDIIGKTHLESGFPKELSKEWEKRIHQVFATGKPCGWEFEWQSANGIVFLDWRLMPEFDENGNVYSVLGISRDITERKQYEMAIANKERYQRALLDNFPFAVWLKDTESRFLAVNQMFANTFRIPTADELVGKTDFDIAEHDAAEEYRAHDRSVMQSRQKQINEEVVVGLGERNWSETYKAPVIDENGELLGTVGFLRDISERKKFEESLKISNDRYNALIQTTAAGFCIVDMKGNIIEVNDSYCKMIGYSSEELKMMKVADLENLELESDTQKHRDQIISDGWARFESQHKCANGSIIYVEVRITYLNEQNLFIVFINDITERKHAEEALRESELRFRLLFDKAPLGYQSLDLDGNFIDVNQEWIDTLGYEREEVIGKWFGNFLSPDYQDGFRKRFPIFKAQGYIHSEFEMVHKNGTLLFIAFEGRIGYDLKGEFKQTHCILQDITERKRAEEEIKHHENYLKSLVYILQHESDTVQEFLDYALQETLRLTGSKFGYIYHYSEERKEFVLNTWSKEVMNECTIMEQQTVYQLDQTGLWGEAVRQRKPIMVNDFQAAHPLKKGYPEGHAHLNKYLTVPVFNNNKIVGVVGVANKEKNYTDADVLQLSLLMNSVWKVVDRKRSEEALIESQARLNATIEQSNDGIAIADLDGNYLEVNPKFCSMTGYTKDELLKMRVFDLNPKNQPAVLFSQFLHEKKSGHQEKELLRKDGSTFYALISGSIIEVGNKQYVQGIIRDITDRKNAEVELEKHRNHLEELVKIRTAELERANELLKLSVEKEKELNEMKSRFISTTSHEFRTPLTSVLSSTELLQRFGSKWSDEKKDEHFNRIITSIDYLTHLLDDILTLNRADTGKISFNPEKLNLHQFANECLLDAESLITDKHELKFNYKSKQKEFQLDPKLMRFVFNNLLSNAMKYSPQGGIVELKISTDKKNLFIEVSDEGIGVPPDEINKIFESFYRTKHVKDIAGTGLGLAIVKRAVDLHNGEISVTSELGKGTTFTVKIPIVVPN